MVLKNLFNSFFGRAEITDQKYSSVEALRKVVIEKLRIAKPT